MLKCIITLYEEAQKAIADSPPEKRITWAYIKTTLTHVLEKVKETKFVVRIYTHNTLRTLHTRLHVGRSAASIPAPWNYTSHFHLLNNSCFD
jgi:hypothetical protein